MSCSPAAVHVVSAFLMRAQSGTTVCFSYCSRFLGVQTQEGLPLSDTSSFPSASFASRSKIEALEANGKLRGGAGSGRKGLGPRPFHSDMDARHRGERSPVLTVFLQVLG